MSQRHGRGHASYTYNINAVADADRERLTLTITHDAQVQPQTFRLEAPADTPVSQQIFDAIIDSLAITGTGGRWESRETLQNNVSNASVLVGELIALGVADLADPAVTLPILREAVNRFDSSMKRTLNTLLARALRLAGHPDARLPANLLNTKHVTQDHQAREPYTEADVEVLRAAAKDLLKHAYEQQRHLFAILGHDTSDRTWWLLGAGEILEAAQQRDIQRSEPLTERRRPPRAGAPVLDQIDWCLLNPHHCADDDRTRRALGPATKSIADALYPPGPVLVAASILHCLVENTGFNHATLLRTEPSDLTRTGIATGRLAVAKARNHTTGHHAVRFVSAYSSTGGLLSLLTALTRFNRWARRRLTAEDGSPHPVADKLYVLHRAEPSRTQLLTVNQTHHGFRAAALRTRLEQHASAAGIAAPTLRFQALRHYALYAGVRTDPDHDVVDHSTRTRVDYLARCVPTAVLGSIADAAHHEMHDAALKAFLGTEHGQPLAAALEQGTAADMAVNVCTSGGNDPQDHDRPCSLGLAACFTCPNGYRTSDNVPGLVALVRFTEIIRDENPQEWTTGDAAALHRYASNSLTKFPAPLVEAARDDRPCQDRHLAIVHQLYTEVRR